MQTYSLGFGGSLFPSMDHTQKVKMQDKPYALLENRDFVSIKSNFGVCSGVDTVCFTGGRKSKTDYLNSMIDICRELGIDEETIKATRSAADNSEVVKNANYNEKSNKKVDEERRLLTILAKKEAEKIGGTVRIGKLVHPIRGDFAVFLEKEAAKNDIILGLNIPKDTFAYSLAGKLNEYDGSKAVYTGSEVKYHFEKAIFKK